MISLPALSNVTFTSVDSRLCVQGVRNVGAIPPNTTDLMLGFGIIGVGGAAALIVANSGNKTVSP